VQSTVGPQNIWDELNFGSNLFRDCTGIVIADSGRVTDAPVRNGGVMPRRVGGCPVGELELEDEGCPIRSSCL
jgi:hypothetical protein